MSLSTSSLLNRPGALSMNSVTGANRGKTYKLGKLTITIYENENYIYIVGNFKQDGTISENGERMKIQFNKNNISESKIFEETEDGWMEVDSGVYIAMLAESLLEYLDGDRSTTGDRGYLSKKYEEVAQKCYEYRERIANR